ncbi:MAG TPA: MBL fold metallo-hydrolase [Solirubrobacterales bacterium]|nr:MBL fold metallo-hydrolase [Solirubrobacterales bacterium]
MAIAYICATCGAQYPPAAEPPAACAICDDERQYVGWDGQRWTTLEELRDGHRADVREEEPGLTGIGSTPPFAIGQRALLVQTDEGNVLWDCLAPFDREMAAAVEARGGIDAIAVSHPHYYTTMVEWSRAFDAPIRLAAADRRWVTRPDGAIDFWDGDRLDLFGGLTLLRLGGHFAGGTVLHWPTGAGGRGALLSGDILQVVADRRWVGFMRSYPNLIPLPAAKVEAMTAALEPWKFDRLYGAWFGRVVDADAHAAVRRSAERYVRAVTEGFGEG